MKHQETFKKWRWNFYWSYFDFQDLCLQTPYLNSSIILCLQIEMLITLQVKGFKSSSRKQGVTNDQETSARSTRSLPFKGGVVSYICCVNAFADHSLASTPPQSQAPKYSSLKCPQVHLALYRFTAFVDMS